MIVWGDAALAVVIGAVFSTGLVLMASRVPRLAAPSLTARIAPHVRDIADPLGLTPLASPRGMRSGLTRWAGLLSGLGSTDRVEHRLRQAGWNIDAAGFRGRQLASAIIGLLVGAVILIGLVIAGRWSPGTIVLPAVGAFLGVAAMDMRLTSAAKARLSRVNEELPTVLEFLALCLSAGEGLRDALRRVGDIGTGELTREVKRVVVATGTGSNLTEALSDLARTLDIASLTRSTDHLIAAIERGAPLAQVLHAQASDAREDAKRELIEQAGRKEILMLLPLVFLILPLSVLFAVFPGMFVLRLGIG